MKTRTIIIMVYIMLLLSGCGGQTAGWQTGDVSLVQTLGVDRVGSEVRISATAGTASGASVAAGVQELCAAGNSFLHIGHVNQLVLGEAFARDGAEPLLDFLARDRRIGPGGRLWVLRDGAAEQAVAADADVSPRLTRLAEERSGSAPKLDCTATRLMSVMARQGSAAVPALTLEQGELMPDGYAVLRRGRLVGFLNREQSLGLELLCGQGAGQVVEVSLPDGTQLVLTVRRAAMAVESAVEDGALYGMYLRCGAQLELAQGAPLTAEQMESAVRQAEGILCGRMAAALACAQLWDSDFVGLERLAQGACSPREWDNTEWETSFRTLNLQVAVGARVRWPADVVEEYGNEA